MYHQIKNEMDKIKLTDTQKIQMWETLSAEDAFTKRKKTRFSHRSGMQVAAALLIGVLILGGVGTGVCYATTGSSPAQIIRALFADADSDAVDALGDSYQASGESIVYENICYTLEGYCYDEDNRLLMAQVCMETTDGSPFLDWDVAYALAEIYESDVAENYENAAAWREACESGAESYESYGDILSYISGQSVTEVMAELGKQGQGSFTNSKWMEKWENSEEEKVFAALTINGVLSWTHTLQAVSDSKAYQTVMSVIPADEYGQEGNADFELALGDAETDIGTFDLEDSGEMPSLTVNCPDMSGVTTFKIFGSGFVFRYDGTDAAVKTIEIVLKDGSSYYFDTYEMEEETSADSEDIGVSESETDIRDENEQLTAIEDSDGQPQEKEREIRSIGSTVYGDEGFTWYYGNFADYMDVNDVAAVYVNGVECEVR